MKQIEKSLLQRRLFSCMKSVKNRGEEFLNGYQLCFLLVLKEPLIRFLYGAALFGFLPAFSEV